MAKFLLLSTLVLATISSVISSDDIGFRAPTSENFSTDVQERRQTMIVGGEDVDLGEYPYFGMYPSSRCLWSDVAQQNNFMYLTILFL
jgi:hypothetical protein